MMKISPDATQNSSQIKSTLVFNLVPSLSKKEEPEDKAAHTNASSRALSDVLMSWGLHQN